MEDFSYAVSEYLDRAYEWATDAGLKLFMAVVIVIVSAFLCFCVWAIGGAIVSGFENAKPVAGVVIDKYSTGPYTTTSVNCAPKMPCTSTEIEHDAECVIIVRPSSDGDPRETVERSLPHWEWETINEGDYYSDERP